MMEGVQHLTTHDLAAALEGLAGGSGRQLFAFFGTGEEETLTLTSGVSLRVLPVRSELELRERMPPLDDEDARIVFLVPWVDDIALDLAGRFASDGRVRRIGVDARLRRLFGVGDIEPAVRRSPLSRYLLRPGPQGRYVSGESLLTADAMWAAWLGADWGVPTAGGLALDVLLGWAATDAGGARFVAAMREEAAGGVRDALLAHLRARLGDAAPLVWAAWEEGRGAAVLELALLFEVLAESPYAAVRMWVKTRVRELMAAEDEATILEVARALGKDAASALRYVENQAGPKAVRACAKAADDRGDDGEVRAALAESTRLPSAWSVRLHALGAALEECARAPREPAFEDAVRALRALEGHVFFKDEDQRHVLQRAEMAVLQQHAQLEVEEVATDGDGHAAERRSADDVERRGGGLDRLVDPLAARAQERGMCLRSCQSSPSGPSTVQTFVRVVSSW